MSSTWHALGDFGESVSESFEVDECSEEGGHLDVGLFTHDSDKGLQRRKAGGFRVPGGSLGWGGDGGAAGDDRSRSVREVVNQLF